MEGSGKIGADGNWKWKFDENLVATTSAGISDKNDSGIDVALRINIAQELLALAKESGHPEAITIVQGLINIAPLMIQAIQSKAPPAP